MARPGFGLTALRAARHCPVCSKLIAERKAGRDSTQCPCRTLSCAALSGGEGLSWTHFALFSGRGAFFTALSVWSRGIAVRTRSTSLSVVLGSDFRTAPGSPCRRSCCFEWRRGHRSRPSSRVSRPGLREPGSLSHESSRPCASGSLRARLILVRNRPGMLRGCSSQAMARHDARGPSKGARYISSPEPEDSSPSAPLVSAAVRRNGSARRGCA